MDNIVNRQKSINTTTLVCIDTDNHVLAQTATLHSAKCYQFDRVLYFSDIDWNIPPFDFVKIKNISCTKEYQKIILKELFFHIKTDYVLVIQFDGFVIRPDRWDDAFFQYDYIGAPWVPHHDNAVGNGGFSLRSRRLLQALQDPTISSSLDEAEDSIICCRYRDYLKEKYGIKFADCDTALRFSYEYDPCPPEGSFGFHGFMNAAAFYQKIDSMFFIDNLGLYNLKTPYIFILVAWYNQLNLLNESHRLLNRIRLVQTEQEMQLGYRNVGLAPHACDKITRQLEKIKNS